MLEKTIERYLKSEVKKAGGLSYKFSSPAHRGVPDQIVLIWGNVHFVEVKSLRGKLSKLQEKCIADMLVHTNNVHVVYSKENVDGFLKYAKIIKDL